MQVDYGRFPPSDLEPAMITLFNVTNTQGGSSECGHIFFMDNITGARDWCQDSGIGKTLPTSLLQSVLTTLQSSTYYSYLAWYPDIKSVILSSVAPQVGYPIGKDAPPFVAATPLHVGR
jgi:hypothetical protein